MQDTVKGLQPQSLWRYFSDLSDIPRESGNEEGVRNYLLDFAKQHGLVSIVDKVGNVILRKKAYPGYENRPSVALQGHMDMVCVKTEGSGHDFTKDPIRLVVDGEYLRAKDTTLGGDNGIALAMALDILSDPDCKHGPLEAIFTVSEETGLNGAFGIEQENIQSRLMINLDSEEEGVLYIGCAGGIEMDAFLPVEWVDIPKGYIAYTLNANGMLGGHSGGEIHQQHANAIKVCARILSKFPKAMVFKAKGGTKRNVIPSTCSVSFALPASEAKEAQDVVKKVTADLKGEHAISDPGLNVELVPTDLPSKAVGEQTSEAFIRSLYIAPHGVDAMSLTIEGVVETSSNLAILNLDEKGFSVISSHRSSVLSSRDDVANRCAAAFRSCNCEVELSGAYPSWTPNPASALTGFCAKAYEEYAGKKPVITAIHAGLECGIINSKIEGMDSVSYGPDMEGAHSVKERLNIASVQRINAFTRHLLGIIE